jgi:hypothetical protein
MLGMARPGCLTFSAISDFLELSQNGDTRPDENRIRAIHTKISHQQPGSVYQIFNFLLHDSHHSVGQNPVRSSDDDIDDEGGYGVGERTQ